MCHRCFEADTLFTFARIDSTEGSPSIQFHRVPAGSETQFVDIERVLNLSGSSRSRQSTQAKSLVDASKKHIIAVNKLINITRALRGQRVKTDGLNVTVQPRNFVAVLPNIKCGKKNHMSFQQIRFDCQRLQHGANFISDQLLHFDYPDVQKTDRTGRKILDKINIITGVCLFGREIMSDLSTDPSLLRLDSSRASTLYQREFIRRSASVIADISMTFLMNTRSYEYNTPRKAGFINVTIDIPSFEYLTKVAEVTDFCHRAQWLECIVQHRKVVCALFEKELYDQLQIRAIESLVRVKISPKFDGAFQKLSDLYLAVFAPEISAIRRCFEAVEHWKEFTTVQEAGKEHKSLKEFGHLKSIFELVQPTLQDLKDGKNSLTVAIDDPWEQALHREANKVLKSYDTSILSIYTCPRIAYQDPESRLFDLWYTDPGWHKLAGNGCDIYSIGQIVDSLHVSKGTCSLPFVHDPPL